MWGLWKWKSVINAFVGKNGKRSGFCGGSNFGRHKAHADRNSGTGLSTSFGMPRRMATGLDYNRITLLMAVLEKRVGMQLHNYDAYVNVVGGLKIDEPACDLGVVTAIASTLETYRWIWIPFNRRSRPDREVRL